MQVGAITLQKQVVERLGQVHLSAWRSKGTQLTRIKLTSHPEEATASWPNTSTSKNTPYPADWADTGSQPATLTSAAVNPSFFIVAGSQPAALKAAASKPAALRDGRSNLAALAVRKSQPADLTSSVEKPALILHPEALKAATSKPADLMDGRSNPAALTSEKSNPSQTVFSKTGLRSVRPSCKARCPQQTILSPGTQRVGRPCARAQRLA